MSSRQNGAERLLSKHEFGLEKLNRRLVGAIFLSEFVVFLFLERFFNLCHLPLMPEDFIFEALNPFLQILGALQRPTLTTSDRDWIKMAGNRFSALTDVEFVLSVKAAILDFTEAEVLGVGGGWVHVDDGLNVSSTLIVTIFAKNSWDDFIINIFVVWTDCFFDIFFLLVTVVTSKPEKTFNRFNNLNGFAGGGWVHIAMILSVCGLRSVSSGLVERFQSTGVVEAPVSTLGEDNTRDVLDGVEAGSLAVLGLFNVIVCQAIVIAIAVV